MNARKILTVAASSLLLAGCYHDYSDLNQYIASVEARKTSHLDPVPQVKPYEPFAYVPADRRDPFTAQANPPPGSRTSNTALRPDMNRAKEPLEQFPLDALRMVGVINFKGVMYAMIKAPDGVVHREAVGDHMGQNYGKITKISDGEVDLNEIVPDGFGGFQERPASVTIAE